MKATTNNTEPSMTRSEEATAYLVRPELEATHVHNKAAEDETIRQAIGYMLARMQAPGALITSPELAKDYFFLKLAEDPAESFNALFLDNRHRVLTMQRLFTGTIDGASVHPREVVRACIKYNAAAIMLCHNHPSGDPEPSRADITLTKRLVDTLALVDVRILDHLIIGASNTKTVSFAERGLI